MFKTQKLENQIGSYKHVKLNFRCIYLTSFLTKNNNLTLYTNKFLYLDFDLKYFWQWSDFQSYVECIMTLAASGGVLMYFLCEVEPFVETVGFLAVFTEAMLGVPQFYRNMRNRSTFGMR